ncbi:MAG: twin-arginine translocation signal domain-containing protein [Trueperaceae bacterium]|nr:twin-arginine translocation signal domain-containing protein [Trueperaceae bacterium]
MKRRDFLKKAGVVAASASLSPLMFANAQRASFRFEMVTSWPTALDTLYGTATRAAEQLRALTDGAVEIEVYPAGAQVGALEVYDAVSSGAFDFGHTAAYYYVGKDQTHGFFTAMPFGLNAQQTNAWFYDGNGIALWNELNERDDLIAFPAGNTGVQMGGWFKKEINTPDDIRGLSMRIPALGGQVFTRAGGNTQTIAAGEIYLALERGTVDAAEWVGPYDDEILGLHRAAPYYYGPAWQEPGPALGLYVNLDTFRGLPADIQQAIETVAQAVNLDMLSRYESRNGAALKRLIAGGTQVRTFPLAVLRHFEAAMNELHDVHRAANPFYARVHDDYLTFAGDVREWGRFSEYPLQDYLHGN